MSWEDLKQKGNECFTKQDYESSVKFYTEALELSSKEHTLYSNRSAALMKLGQSEGALQDATACIELQPSFARGYLRKCVALNKLERYNEATEVAQEGYKLRGSDVISKSCVSEWLMATQALLKGKIDSIQEEIDFEFPKQFTVISENYLTLLLDCFVAYSNSMTEASIEEMTTQLSKIMHELDRILQLFGHSQNPHGTAWVKAVVEASKLDTSSLKVPTKAVESVMEVSVQMLAWLKEGVDHIIYPIVRPCFYLAVMSMRVRFIYLNYLQIERHVVEVGCRVCLLLFENSILSLPEYAEQHIEIYNELVSATFTPVGTLQEDELQSAELVMKKMQSIIKQSPQCSPDVLETASLSIGIIEAMLGQEFSCGDLAFKNVLMSRSSVDEVLSFVESHIEPLQLLLNNTSVNDQLPDGALRDSQIFLSCTGVLLSANMIARATEVFQLGESVVISILKRRTLLKTFTLDTAPMLFYTLQSNIFMYAKSFLGINDKLLADVIIRWKCIFSEFRAQLIQSGLGLQYRSTFKSLQQLHLKEGNPADGNNFDLSQLSETHQKEVHKMVSTNGRHILQALFQQHHEEILSMLKPSQMILEYCSLHDEQAVCNPDSSDSVNDLLLVLQPELAPVLKSVSFDEISKRIGQCSMTKDLCHLLIPTEVQEKIISGHVKELFVCLDSTFHGLLVELLPLYTGQLLYEKCAVIRLSAAREFLRQSMISTSHCMFPISLIKKEAAGEDHAINKGINELDLTLNSDGEPSIKDCVIFADPNYDLKLSKGSKYKSLFENMMATMSALFLEPSNTKSLVCPLPESRDEAREVQLILDATKHALKSHCFLGDEATLASVFQIESPFILHFSTHGFSESSQLVHGTFVDDTKSGLLLAGTNTYRRGDLSKIDPTASTGVLTALGVMGMNLHNTRLVYLSTCSSAAGFTASGESINSLAEAFRIAGAMTVVATLFPVTDKEAQMFTVHFYREACKDGVKPSQALISAKKMMEHSGYHWVLWSSFICLGNDMPLFP